ncbi:MAG: hypothetical protein ABEK36_05265 [Candidatus Aenigmatarchaeota archaeon]
MGKIKANIILRDNSIIEKTIKNPDKFNYLSYKIGTEKVSKPYEFDIKCLFTKKKLLRKKKIIFYKEGILKPLKNDFKNDETSSKEMCDIIETSLFRALIDSTKTKNPLTIMNFGIIVIIIIVIIIVVGKQIGF